jgi:23S rRNA pseudouridine2605 synthase
VYETWVVGSPADEDVEKLRRGVFIEGRRTAPATVRRGATSGKGAKQLTKLTIGLHEGRNRQVRRMLASIGHPVRRLTRIRMGPVSLGDLRPGQWRDLTPKEVRLLQEAASRPSRAAR